MMHNREAFLNNIAKSLGRARVEKVDRPVRQFQPELKVFSEMSEADLLEQMKEECKKIHTHILVTDTQSLPAVLTEQISNHGGGTIVMPKDPRFQDYGLESFLQRDDVHTWDPLLGKVNIDYAEQANIGVMFSDITLAESATAVIFNDKHRARSISLLPTTFIAILPKSSIVQRMTQATQAIQKKIEAGETIASCVNFISGPSNSADIEYNHVVGVHGPIRASYIVVEDQ